MSEDQKQEESPGLARLLQVAEANHKADIARIGAVLLDQAKRNDWCDEFDIQLARVNKSLNCKLPTRQRRKTVELRGVVQVEWTKEVDILIDFGASVEEIHDAAAQVLVDKYHMTDCDFDLDYGTDWGQETEVVSVYSSDT